MATIITALLPVFVTLLLGYFAAWHQDEGGKAATTLNKLVMTYLVVRQRHHPAGANTDAVDPDRDEHARRLAVVRSLAFLLLPLAGVAGKPMSESVVALAMPSAVMLIILSVRYRVAEKESASVLLYTYMFSALSMAAAVLLTK